MLTDIATIVAGSDTVTAVTHLAQAVRDQLPTITTWLRAVTAAINTVNAVRRLLRRTV